MNARSMFRRVLPAAGLLCAAWCAALSLACDFNVREAGFLNNTLGPYFPAQYKLVLLAPRETPETKQLADGLREIGRELAESNFSAALFHAEKISDADRKSLKADGIALDKLPQSFLFVQTPMDRNVLFSEPRLFTVAEIRSLAASPARLKLQGLLADNGNYCVILLVPGRNAKANASAEKAVAEAVRACAPNLRNQKIVTLRVDRGERAERLFLREFDLAEGTNTVCAMVFGKGRIVTPLLHGEEITSERLEGMFRFLQTNASDCTPDAVYLPGTVVDMIMPWSNQLDARMYKAIARSGVIPNLAWMEAEIDPKTGEMIDRPAPR